MSFKNIFKRTRKGPKGIVEHDYRYGYLDDSQNNKRFEWKIIPLVLAILFLVVCWLFLTQKILFGANWLSPTYDNADWRTNENNGQTYGAWDLETHIWKSEFVIQNWPHVLWNPYWYLGMPLFKYYQAGFYAVHIAIIKSFGLDPSRAANLLVIFGHLAAVIATFFLTLRISRRYTVAALSAFFIIANTFISLRSYGWEPITVAFLAFYPIGLLVFFREPLRPFRFWMIITLAAAYIMHPLIWFSLCMTMGIYLMTIAISSSLKRDKEHDISRRKVFTQYFVLVLCSLLLGGFQAVNQFSYKQVTSGAHMGVTYLPQYHIQYNIITLKDFFFDFGNLKGPGPIMLLAAMFIVIFGAFLAFGSDNESNNNSTRKRPSLWDNEMILGLVMVLAIMILFYYLEYFNIFPMNQLRSIQYHRIIPEFIVIAACVIAALSAKLQSRHLKPVYYISLFSFMLGGLIIIYSVQTHWQTSDSISEKPEFLNESIPGRISMPYTEQSLSVRSSFTQHPQAYGYYEQGITNSYDDEIFSVSSGYHNTNTTLLYLKATDITRLYINTQEQGRNVVVMNLFNSTLPLIEDNSRYSYYPIPVSNPSFAQAVPEDDAQAVKKLEPGCRILFHQRYCGSVGEEFVSKDAKENAYLQAYVDMLEKPYFSSAEFTMIDPDHYRIDVHNATNSTAVVIKMTKDSSWTARIEEISNDPEVDGSKNSNAKEDNAISHASIDAKDIPIDTIGPDFMIVSPHAQGDYTIVLTYHLNKEYIIGGILSIITFIIICVYFIAKPSWSFGFPHGDMDGYEEKNKRNHK